MQSSAGGSADARLPPLDGVSLADVRSIVLMLYDARTAPAVRKQVDRWLDKYCLRKEAWTMADAFLKEPLPQPNSADATTSQQLMLFAAITMHHKIRYDFEELPESMHGSLR